MKKILILLLGLICLTGCDTVCNIDKKGYSYETSKGEIVIKNVTERDPVSMGEGFRIVEITYNGETHEYIDGNYVLTHWAGCKYCKEYKNESH